MHIIITMRIKREQLILTRGIWDSLLKEAALQLSISTDFCAAILTSGTFWPDYLNPDILMWPKTTNHYTFSSFINDQVIFKTEDLSPFPTLTYHNASLYHWEEWGSRMEWECGIFMIFMYQNRTLTTFGHFIKGHKS